MGGVIISWALPLQQLQPLTGYRGLPETQVHVPYLKAVPHNNKQHHRSLDHEKKEHCQEILKNFTYFSKEIWKNKESDSA